MTDKDETQSRDDEPTAVIEPVVDDTAPTQQMPPVETESADEPTDAATPADTQPPGEVPPLVPEPIEPEGPETQFIPPVIDEITEDGDVAGEAESASAPVEEPPVGDTAAAADAQEPEPTATSERNWMGVTAFVTGALLLSLIAIVLGHLGLSAAKNGKATNRNFALAGTVLGYVGLVLTVVGGYLLMQASEPEPETVDLYAQHDIVSVGNATVLAVGESGPVPEVVQTESGYTVDGDAIETALTTEHTLTVVGSTANDWCLQLDYEGGTESAYSYMPGTGVVPGTVCVG